MCHIFSPAAGGEEGVPLQGSATRLLALRPVLQSLGGGGSFSEEWVAETPGYAEAASPRRDATHLTVRGHPLGSKRVGKKAGRLEMVKLQMG